MQLQTVDYFILTLYFVFVLGIGWLVRPAMIFTGVFVMHFYYGSGVGRGGAI